MPSAVSQKWLAMHLKCPSRMMDLFTAAAIWLEKIHVQQLDIEKRQHFAWRFFQSGLQFQVSNLPKKGEQTQLFMEKNLNRRFSNKKFEVLVLLLPVAIVSPYAAWKAWHPTFEPLASPPKIEFKSIEVPSSSLAFLAVLCFVFLLLEVFRCCSNFFWKLQISPYFVEVIRVKHAAWLSKVIWSFPRSTRWKIPCRTLWKDSAPWLSKEIQELHGLNLAPIEPQVFQKQLRLWGVLTPGWLCRMPRPLLCLLQFPFICLPNDCFLGFGGRIIFNVWAFISFTCLPDVCLRDDCSPALLAGSFSDVCVPSFLFICFHTMIFLLVSWPDLLATFVFWFLLICLEMLARLDACLAQITFQCSLPHGFRCWTHWPDHFPASLSAFACICLPHGISCPLPFPHCVSSTASTTWNMTKWCRCLTFHPVTFGSTNATT